MTDLGSLRPGGPRVVAIGGGHGLAQTLRAVRRYAGCITAIVSVADNGGSSGRLREELGMPAPGDIRRCLGALLPEVSPLGEALEHRFESGQLAGHAFGNLLIAALAASTGDFGRGVSEAGRLLGTVGTVLPATIGSVDLKAISQDGEIDGQVSIQASHGVTKLSLVPPDALPPDGAVRAIMAAEQVVIGPGSLYTSVMAACCVPALSDAIRATNAQRVYVVNLREQRPETAGYSVADHVEALGRHGIAVDVVVADPRALPPGRPLPAGRSGCPPRLVLAEVGQPGYGAHDPDLLTGELEKLAGESRPLGA
ncbi:MAG: gluconeogenesis factor YvcK family protein [Acidimicrobiales bacterium]